MTVYTEIYVSKLINNNFASSKAEARYILENLQKRMDQAGYPSERQNHLLNRFVEYTIKDSDMLERYLQIEDNLRESRANTDHTMVYCDDMFRQCWSEAVATVLTCQMLDGIEKDGEKVAERGVEIKQEYASKFSDIGTDLSKKKISELLKDLDKGSFEIENLVLSGKMGNEYYVEFTAMLEERYQPYSKREMKVMVPEEKSESRRILLLKGLDEKIKNFNTLNKDQSAIEAMHTKPYYSEGAAQAIYPVIEILKQEDGSYLMQKSMAIEMIYAPDYQRDTHER